MHYAHFNRVEFNSIIYRDATRTKGTQYTNMIAKKNRDAMAFTLIGGGGGGGGALLMLLLMSAASLPRPCHGHGRLIEPPSRASAWRYGFQTPPNYNDHELYCGGFQRQQRNGGKCGECGDAWDVPLPRPNEYGGRWGQGVVVRKYNPSADITLRVELTASHMG